MFYSFLITSTITDSFFIRMNLSPLQLLLIVLVSMLLGAIITFSLFHFTEIKLVIGSIIFTLTLLVMLLVQFHQARAKQ